MKKFWGSKNHQASNLYDNPNPANAQSSTSNMQSQIITSSTIQNQQSKIARQQTSPSVRPQEDYSESDYHNDSPNDELQQYISTTAGGDGLEFDSRHSNIFEEIDRIKSDSDSQTQSLQKVDVGFTMKDIPDNLEPLSILLESTQNLEQIKGDLQQFRQKEEEYLQIIRNLKLDTPINTCSYTLNLLMNTYKTQQDINENLEQQVLLLQTQMFALNQQEVQSKVVIHSNEKEINSLKKEIEYYVDENRRLKVHLEVLKRQKEEQALMQNEESRKAIADSQIFREKIDKYKLEIHQLKRRLVEVEKYELLYEDLKTRDNERQKQDILMKTKEQLKLQQIQKSLLGHLKTLKLKTFTQNVSSFSLETCLYLEEEDIMKIPSLNRNFAQTFLKYNQRLFLRMFFTKSKEMVLKIKDLQQKCDMQSFIIKRNEARDHMRQMIIHDSGDDRIRYIIEKHVVKNHGKGTEIIQNPITIEMEHTIMGMQNFMGGYYDQIKNFQEQQIKLKQDQLVKQSQLNTSHSLIDISMSQLNPQKPGGYKIVNAGRKIVGALSFGRFRRKNTNENSQQDTDISEQKIETSPEQIEEISEALIDLTSDHEVTSNEEIKQENQVEQIETSDTVDQIKPSSDILVNSVDTSTNSQLFEEAKGQASSPNSRKNSQEFQPKLASLSTLKALDDISNIEDMHDFLYTVGTHLVSEKQKLSQWIRGLQEGFASFYILAKNLSSETQELELLKNFLVLRVENLKLRVHELLNEKEDMAAIHQSDSGVKEHLIQRIHELDKSHMEKSTELLFVKKRVQELSEEKKEFDSKLEKQQFEIKAFKERVIREGKLLRDRVGRLTDENLAYRKAIDEMKVFFQKLK